MASWLLKAAAQGAVSVLPARDRLNAALQARVTGTAGLTDAHIELKLRRVRRHLRRYRRVVDRAAGDARPRVAFELGTGWYPIVPVGLALSGVERVITFDVRPLAGAERVQALLARLAALRDAGTLPEHLPGLDPERARRLDGHGTTAAEMLAPLGVELRVGDPGPRPEGGVELFISDNTLEHIPPDELRALLGRLAALAAPGAVMDHFIDMRDHYATFDRSLGRLNFLRYPDPVWRLFNNRMQYQNRLRLPDYRELLREAGFRVVIEGRMDGEPGEFDGLRLARRFRAMPRAEALALYAWLTAVADAPDP